MKNNIAVKGQGLEVGQAILICDENRVMHAGLVTTNHGWKSKEARDEALEKSAEYWRESDRYTDSEKAGFQKNLEASKAAPMIEPVINALYISDDPKKHDPYGQQTERLSSLQHKDSVSSMTNPGRYWDYL